MLSILCSQEKLFSSKNRTEASLGKKLKIDMLPEIEKVHKRSACLGMQRETAGAVGEVGPRWKSKRLNDLESKWALKWPGSRGLAGALNEKGRRPQNLLSEENSVQNLMFLQMVDGVLHKFLVSFEAPSPKSPDYDETDEDHNSEPLDRSNRRRQRPQRYSAKEYVEAVSDNEADFDSDDDIVGEAVYDEEYLRRRKQRKMSSSSEGDEEYHWDEENAEEEEEEEDSLSISEESDEPQRFKKLPSRTQYEVSESGTESMKSENSNASGEHSDASDNAEFSMGSEEYEGNNDNQEMKIDLGSEDYEGNNDNQEMKIDQPVEQHPETVEKEQNWPPEKSNSPGQDEVEGVKKRRFLDLNELAPGSGFDDGPSTTMKDEDRDDF
ncbi:hypothetical protein F0562_024958 [Nyssa sinensis]|uniref:Uncharacterized protein n=1 Tax=Nyssa sinensis TaxID=561372 RepID=A0A5J5BE00_9ASTE|nr:hypothetical protein F0562_024958 [Nyssa sinensis]